jgi:hypothetical protein
VSEAIDLPAKPGDRVCAYGRTGRIIRLKTKWKQAGADVIFDGKQFTEWYPLSALTLKQR